METAESRYGLDGDPRRSRPVRRSDSMIFIVIWSARKRSSSFGPLYSEREHRERRATCRLRCRRPPSLASRRTRLRPMMRPPAPITARRLRGGPVQEVAGPATPVAGRSGSCCSTPGLRQRVRERDHVGDQSAGRSRALNTTASSSGVTLEQITCREVESRRAAGHDRLQRAAPERRFAGQHLVDDAGQAVLVAAPSASTPTPVPDSCTAGCRPQRRFG